jgi:hypothetical protein
MRRFGTFIVLALAIALGLFWAADRMLDVGDKPETTNQPVPSTEQGSGASQRVPRGQDWRKQTKNEQSRAGTQPEAQLQDQQPFPADPAPITQPGVQAQPRLQTEAQSPDTDQPQEIDFSVVGSAFPVSESILAACDPTRHAYGTDSSCEPNRKFLAEFAGEPREEPWATYAERAIRALVELEPGTDTPRAVTYTIRALECRTSICFVETASIIDWFGTQLYYFEKTSGLTAQYPIFSTETDPSGNKVRVTLWPFVRN